MNDYVSKPVTPQALAAVLETWLPAESAVAVFDRPALLERLMGDEALAMTVQKMFLETMPGQIAALRDCLEAGDAPGTERQAHSLKGASANVGGQAVWAVAGEIEQAARAGEVDAAKARLAALELQFTRLREAMERETAGES